jgi:hypothetical protein
MAYNDINFKCLRLRSSLVFVYSVIGIAFKTNTLMVSTAQHGRVHRVLSPSRKSQEISDSSR